MSFYPTIFQSKNVHANVVFTIFEAAVEFIILIIIAVKTFADLETVSSRTTLNRKIFSMLFLLDQFPSLNADRKYLNVFFKPSTYHRCDFPIILNKHRMLVQ